MIAACNEAEAIASALRTLVNQDYPNLEILVVDDRSTDGTGAIVAALAKEHPCIRPLDVRSLPAGWLSYRRHERKDAATAFSSSTAGSSRAVTGRSALAARSQSSAAFTVRTFTVSRGPG